MHGYARIVFGLVYSVCYIYLAVGAAGGGHGTFIFFTPLPSWILMLAALFLLSWIEKPSVRYVVLVLIILHYLITFYIAYTVESADHFAHTIRILELYPYMFAFTVFWYIAGQAVFWVFYFRGFSSALRSAP